jgi:tRNA wybutosine-synthesizing protein 3
MVADLPTGWELHGDLVLLPKDAFRQADWQMLASVEKGMNDLTELWRVVAEALAVERVARKGEISGGERRPDVEMLLGEDGWVTHREHGIDYSFDVTKSMFSAGNLSERGRIGELSCTGETVLDLYAGIGYWTLPLLIRAGASHVHACEWSEDSLHALGHNLTANGVADRCTVHAGDNRETLISTGSTNDSTTAVLGSCDRVLLGLLPNSKAGWPLALAALKPEGGWLHLHGNAPGGEEEAWGDSVVRELSEMDGRPVTVERLVKVKWHAPHVRHCVLDLSIG